MQCKLCEREVGRLTVHHLVPRQRTKRKKQSPGPTVEICAACHGQIHATFDNKRLAEEFNTIEKLKNEPQMEKFLSWVRKQKADRRIQVRRQRS